jgi:hypothetical protein
MAVLGRFAAALRAAERLIHLWEIKAELRQKLLERRPKFGRKKSDLSYWCSLI